MMAFLIAATLTGPGDARKPSAQTIVGTWAYVHAHRDASIPVEPCATDDGIRYERDGRWSDLMGDERGTWSVRGNVLSERVTHRYDDTQISRAVREPLSRSPLRWFSPDHVNVGLGPNAWGLIRCPTDPD